MFCFCQKDNVVQHACVGMFTAMFSEVLVDCLLEWNFCAMFLEVMVIWWCDCGSIY